MTLILKNKSSLQLTKKIKKDYQKGLSKKSAVFIFVLCGFSTPAVQVHVYHYMHAG
jgi:hypothetical protein